jgi:hypothetical protein
MEPSPREERLATNEALFRAANERMAEWKEIHEDEEHELYLCECADPGCHERIPLTREQYEHVRADSRHFAVRAAHVIPDIEVVVEDFGEWVVVEKPPEVSETVERLDPRT